MISPPLYRCSSLLSPLTTIATRFTRQRSRHHLVSFPYLYNWHLHLHWHSYLQYSTTTTTSAAAAASSTTTETTSSSTTQCPRLATLRVHGPDGKGIVAACANLLDQQGYEIMGSEHWTDRYQNLLFLRLLFSKHEPDVTTNRCQRRQVLQNDLIDYCGQRQLHFDLNWRDHRPKVALWVSKSNHCFWELLLRHQAQELDCDLVAVLSNHEHHRTIAESFGLPYYCHAITPDTKAAQEEQQLAILQHLQVDLLVLARYMQVLSPQFLSHWRTHQVINIHHSFLPAFGGKRPYHAAHARGVKLIGATAHYVTPALDQGPILHQDVMDVSHRDGVGGLIRKGRILERNVLLHALQAHLDDRVIVYDNKCVVFGD